MTPPSRLRRPRSRRPPPLPGEKVSASTLGRKWWRQASVAGVRRTRAPAGGEAFFPFPGVGSEPRPGSPDFEPETDRTLPNTQRGVISSSLNTTAKRSPPVPCGRASREVGVPRVTVAPSKATTGSNAASGSRSGEARKSRPSGSPFPAGPRSVKTGISTGRPEPARATSRAIRSSTAAPSCRIAASSGSMRKDALPWRRSRRNAAVTESVRPSATTASARVKPAVSGRRRGAAGILRTESGEALPRTG